MDAGLLFTAIVAVLVIRYVFGLWLDLLNFTHRSKPLAAELQGIYEEPLYSKQQEYQRANTRFGFVSGFFGFAVMLAFLLSGGFGWLDSLVRQVTENPVWMALLFFGALALASELLIIPFEVYDTFVIEERFGFNKTSTRTFIADRLKTWMLALVFGGGLLALIILILLRWPALFWLYAWMILAVFFLFITFFYSTLIVPLFNRQTPLVEGELRTAIEALAKKAGFRLKGIFVIDGTKRSSKANAYFTGFGPNKRIVLYDSLISDLTTPETLAVIAHEIGHYRRHHILINLAVSLANAAITLYILGLFINNPLLGQAIGVGQPSPHAGLIAFALLYSPMSFVVGIYINLWHRRAEFQADRFAQGYVPATDLVSALKRLSGHNLSNLNPHPYYVFFHYSHPTLLQRIRALTNNPTHE